MRDDLSDVQVGDRLMVQGRRGGTESYKKVERITAKQIVLAGGSRFWTKDGREVGASSDRWGGTRLAFKPTEDQIESFREMVRRARVRKALEEDPPNKWPLAQLEAVERLIEEREKLKRP